MLNVKHLMDPVRPDEDGVRIWVEPVGLTHDLVEWCRVDFVVPMLAPPRGLREWFEQHPDAYEAFRGIYHERLEGRGPRHLLRQLAAAAVDGHVTLLHQGDNPAENTATALYEYLAELQSRLPPGAS